jgi:RHS repeat-associated protein
MAGTYKFKISNSNNGFDFGGKHYTAGDGFGPVDACQMKDFLNASQMANLDSGIDEQTGSLAQLEEDCKEITNNTNPQPDSGSAPSEEKPADGNPDSGTNQGAPRPKTAGTVALNEDPQTGDTGIAPGEEPDRPDEGEPHPTHSGEKNAEPTTAGDPIDIFSGAFYLLETDIEIPHTILPLAFTRFYRSGAAAYGPFGWNWDHNFNLYLRELNDGNIAVWRNLHEDIFKSDGLNFEPPRGIFEKLKRLPGLTQVYEINGKSGIKMRFERPVGWMDGERIPIQSITDRDGNALKFIYGPEDKLVQVRDDDDRFFKFDYDHCGLLTTVSDQAGRKFEYAHDEQTMQLTQVKSPGIADHPEGISRTYFYEQPWAFPELRHNIIRVEDAKGQVYLENKYDQDPASPGYARITEQLYGDYLYQFQYTPLQWVPPNVLYINIPAIRIEVMNPDFGLETYTFNYRGDLLDRRYRLNKDKTFRVVVWQYEFDEQGNLSKTTKPDGAEEINVYDFSNPDPRMRNSLLQREITSAAGFPSPSRIIWKGKYEPGYHRLKEEKNEAGARISYRYDFDITPLAPTNTGKLIEIIQPDTTLPDGSIQKAKTTFEYRPNGQLAAIVQSNGSRNEFIYGNAGVEKNRLVKQVVDAGILDIELQVRYDSFGFISESIDGNGNLIKQVFNSLGLLEKRILPAVNGLAAEHMLHYNADKKVVSSQKPKGNYQDPVLTGSHISDQIQRDVLGFPTGIVLGSNTNEVRILKIKNDFRGQPIETIYPDGTKVRKVFDERGLALTEEIVGFDGKKITAKKVYDRSGKLSQETNPHALTTKYEYDGFSRISKVVLPNKTEIRNQWAKNDLLRSQEIWGDDGSGSVSQLSRKSFGYDGKNRKITETDRVFTDKPAVFNDVTITYFYDKTDRIDRIIDNRGGSSTKGYDGLGRLISETDAMGNENHYSYDGNSNLIHTKKRHKEPNGTVSELTKKFKFDERNRRIEVIEPDGSKITCNYDDRNLLVRTMDLGGVITENFYNSHEDKFKVIHDPGGLNIVHRWTFDYQSRVTSYTDPTGQITNYLFDSVGRNYKVEHPNGFSSIKTFNSFHQIVQERLGSGAKFDYAYDSANRLVKIIDSAVSSSSKKTETHEFTYDGLGRVLTAKAGLSLISRKYDSLGRLLSESSSAITLACKYNDATGVVEKIWPDGRVEKLYHDLNGALSKIEKTSDGALGSGSNQIAGFVPSGPFAFGEARYPGGVTIENSYDERKRLIETIVQSPSGTNERIKYRYDKADVKRVEALTGQNPKTSFFEFDNRYRLINAKHGLVVTVPDAQTQADHDHAINLVEAASLYGIDRESFVYNQADDRTKYTETGSPVQDYLFFPGHKIQNDGTGLHTYHTEGTVKSDGTLYFEVDTLGRIVSIKSGAALLLDVSYDALGRPSELKEPGQAVKSFNYLGGFIEQENAGGVAVRQISIHPVTGIPIAYHSTLGTHYTMFDNRFNLVGLLDTNGNLLETYRYKSFGLPQIFDEGGSAVSKSAFGMEPIFGGQKYLSGTKLYLSRKRLMDPKKGAFLSGDPKGYGDSSSLYVYAAQNPINRIDPNGEIAPVAIAIIIGAIAGAGYCIYDAFDPDNIKYDGWGALSALPYTFGGAAIGGVAAVGGEAILAIGGTGAFAGTGAATSLSASQTFLLYGTSSAVSGGVLRGGFNYMFPQYVNPVTARSVTIDFVSGGAIGASLRALTNYATTPGVGTFNPIPAKGKFAEWLRFGNDGTGLAEDAGALGAYPGAIGKILDKIGIRQGDASFIINNGTNPVARFNIAVHEGFHSLVARYLPTFRNLSNFNSLGAIARYPEEVAAYAIGHAAVGRIHAVPLSPFLAFNSLHDYGPAGIEAAKLFWGRLAGVTGVALAQQAFNSYPNEMTSSK